MSKTLRHKRRGSKRGTNRWNNHTTATMTKKLYDKYSPHAPATISDGAIVMRQIDDSSVTSSNIDLAQMISDTAKHLLESAKAEGIKLIPNPNVFQFATEATESPMVEMKQMYRFGKTLSLKNEGEPLIYSYNSPAKTSRIEPLKLPEGDLFDNAVKQLTAEENYQLDCLLTVFNQHLCNPTTTPILVTDISPVFAHRFGFHTTPVNYFNTMPPKEATEWDDDEKPSS